ncbi:MAG: hypothetical protein EOP06_00245 [Proteobacteria bacterium]|nr:MAG: hypothetical protein EOP06_00245 [Pseudomonadota bacterium]
MRNSLKVFAAVLVCLVSISASAQRGGRDNPRIGGEDRGRQGVRCTIYTSDYTRYDGQGRTCAEAQREAIGECIYGQKARGVANWDRCAHAINPGRKYTMSCTDGCGY